MKDQLHIPGSADSDDPNELHMVIVLGWAVSMLFCIGLFLFFRDRRPEPPHQGAEQAVAAHAAGEDRPGASGAGLADPVAETFRVGPRDKAEATCAEQRPQLASGELSRAADIELLKVLDRRAPYAPWTCLLRAYLDEEISPQLEIHGEMAQFWRQARAFEVPEHTLRPTLEAFRQSGDYPQSAEWTHWLRLCAMNPRARVRSACAGVLADIAPAQGEDALAMVEKHLEQADPTELAADMDLVVEGLGSLAGAGQPLGWRVKKTEAIADYNGALQIGAAFMLCRIVNSPDAQVAGTAAFALAEAASMSARDADTKMVRRWRESCQFAFTDYGAHVEDDDDGEDAPEYDGAPTYAPADVAQAPEADSAAAPAPTAASNADTDAEDAPEAKKSGLEVLAVWDGVEGSRPDYTLQGAVKRGICPAQTNRPIWYCGVTQWRGSREASFDLTLQKFFIKTSYVEWLDF